MAKQKKGTDQESNVPTSGEVRDNLAKTLAESLNKQFKDYKVAYFLDGSEETPTDLTEWVGTGSSELDLALSNRPNGGIPFGRLGEITGLEASGKSLIASHILANTQKKGGLAVYIDTENALNVDFLEAIGMDTEKMLYVQLETVEEIFQAIEDIIEKVRSSNKDKLVTIVVDSVAAASTKQELEGDYDKDGWATAKAIIISKAMRKITNLVAKQHIALIFTNQLRQKLGVSFGDQWCVNPYTTKIKIRYKNNMDDEYIYEELTLAELSERFLLNNDFKTPCVYDMEDMQIEVQSMIGYVPIKSFLVKPEVLEYYSDGILDGTSHHRVIENGIEIHLKDHPDFKKINECMDVVDIEVEGGKYLANGRLNHNTTSGGKALAFHCSWRLRAKQLGSIKAKVNGVEQVVGIRTEVKVVKNRMGPPHRSAEFNILFDRGIDDVGGWIETMKSFGIVSQGGAWYTYVDKNSGEEIKFQEKQFRDILNEKPYIRDAMYNDICDCRIMKYKKSDGNSKPLYDADEIEVGEPTVGSEE